MTAPKDQAPGLVADEVWLPVVGYEGKYEVSSHGRVRSLRFINHICDKVLDEPRILKPSLYSGYLAVNLSKNGEARKSLVHHLVATAFKGPRPVGMVCAHLTGKSTENHKDNLDWVSTSENERHKLEHGTSARGENTYNAKLTEADVRYIRDQRSSKTHKQLAERFGINRTTVQRIMYGKAWAHVQ